MGKGGELKSKDGGHVERSEKGNIAGRRPYLLTCSDVMLREMGIQEHVCSITCVFKQENALAPICRMG